MKPFLIAATLITVGLFVVPYAGLAQDSVEDLSKQALHECRQGREALERQARLVHFQKGQVLAEQAVLLNEQYADAHFSLFCNLGEQLRTDGDSITSVIGFRRMMSELERTLELSPGHLDALSAKGTLLVKLPRVLGGDLERGEQLLQRVLQRAPKAVNARLALARVQYKRGRHQEALTLASDALAIAQKHKRAAFIPEAKAMLQQLHITATKATYKSPL